MEFHILMDAVQRLRDTVGFGMEVTSAYRHPSHPIEAKKLANGKPAGQHTIAAIDLAVSRGQAYVVAREAFKAGFTGIGFQQKGEGRFVHLDLRPESEATIWSY